MFPFHRIKEFNRVLGGGLVIGSVVLFGGHPGIGKSTLLLQLSCLLDKEVLYVSGEESASQIKMRCKRLGHAGDKCYLLGETDLAVILEQANSLRPVLIVIDSIQTIYHPEVDGVSGSINQLRVCTAELQRFAKISGIPVIIVGHITKEGGLAGPKTLEHIVDVVLNFEGDRSFNFRLLRSLKNRFGSTDEIGMYEMGLKGLKGISDFSGFFLNRETDRIAGSAIAVAVEGVRPILIETQALVSSSIYGVPQRSTTGFDSKRLNMLIAVLEKKMRTIFWSAGHICQCSRWAKNF